MQLAKTAERPQPLISATNPKVTINSPVGMVMLGTDAIDQIPRAEIPVFPGLKFKYV